MYAKHTMSATEHGFETEAWKHILLTSWYVIIIIIIIKQENDYSDHTGGRGHCSHDIRTLLRVSGLVVARLSHADPPIFIPSFSADSDLRSTNASITVCNLVHIQSFGIV